MNSFKNSIGSQDELHNTLTELPDRAESSESGIVLALCAALIFYILAFGGVEQWSTFLFESAAAILFLLWAGKQFFARQLKLSTHPLYLPTTLFF